MADAMVDITESGKYEAHVFLGVWTIWKEIGPSKDIVGMIDQVCVYPPTYRNPVPIAGFGKIVPLPDWASARLKKDRR